MEHSEDDLVGQPLDDVPKREPDEDCNARRSDNGRFVGYCDRTAGWGTDSDEGRCSTHGGNGGAPKGNSNAKGNDGGGEEGNQNATTHGLYAETNAFYQQVLGDDLRALVDDIFADYLDRYRELHGEPTTGDEAELFRIAVSYGKHVHADNWALEKPDSLDSGHAMVDQETKVSESGREYHTYKEHVVAKGQARLSRDRRAWLKDLGLLDDPQSQTADAVDGVISILSQEANGER